MFSVWVSFSSSYLDLLNRLACLYACLSSNTGHYQPLYPFLFFWDSHNVHIGPFDAVPKSPLALFTVIFSFCSSDSIISLFLYSSSLILFSACPKLPLNPSSEFFVSVTFQLQDFFLGFMWVFNLFTDVSTFIIHHFLDVLHIFL